MTNDKIDYVKNTSGGGYVAVGITGGAGFVLRHNLEDATFRDMAMVGRSFTAAKRYADELIAKAALASPGHLARGLDSRNAPGCALSVRMNAERARKEAKGDVKPIAPKPIAAKPIAAKPKGNDGSQPITVLIKPDDSGLAKGSGRYAKLMAATKAKTLGDLLGKMVTDSTGKQHNVDNGAISGMVKRGHIRLG